MLISYNPNLKLSKIPPKYANVRYVMSGVFSPTRAKFIVTDGRVLFVLDSTDGLPHQDYGIHILTEIADASHDYYLPPALMAEFEKIGVKMAKSSDIVAIDVETGRVVLFNGTKVVAELSKPFDVKKAPPTEIEKLFELYSRSMSIKPTIQTITIGLEPGLLSTVADVLKRGIGKGKNATPPPLKLGVKINAGKHKALVAMHPLFVETGLNGELTGLLMPARIDGDYKEIW